MKGLHDDVGHMGRDKTLELVRQRVYWPRMSTDIKLKLKSCERCPKRNTPVTDRAELVNIKTTQPLKLVSVDYMTLEMSKGGYQHILVTADNFTRYAWAVPTKNQSARTTAESLYYHFLVHYGFPQKLHTDGAANFTSKVISELCALTGIKKTRTSPYHPMGNSLTERFNRSLLNMLGTLDPCKKENWKSYVSPIVSAYNSTKHVVSPKVSPAFLMYDRHPRLPIDLILSIPKGEGESSYTKYVSDLRSRLSEA